MAAETYELTVSGTLAGQFVQNILHVNIDNSGSTPPYQMAQALLDTINGTVDFVQFWCDALPTDYKMTSLRAKRILATGGPTAIILQSALVEDTGQRSGTIQSAQVNPVIILLTTINPSRPGKVFLPGVSETDLNAMVYQAGLIAAINNLTDVFVDQFTIDTLTYDANFAVYRRVLGQSNDISAARLSPLIGTQRRRLRPV